MHWVYVRMVNIIFSNSGSCNFGYSKKPPFQNSIFKLLNLKENITFLDGDINNFKNLKIFSKTNPDLIFHLAANPIVKDCHFNPVEAFHSNAIGTSTYWK